MGQNVLRSKQKRECPSEKNVNEGSFQRLFGYDIVRSLVGNGGMYRAGLLYSMAGCSEPLTGQVVPLPIPLIGKS